MSTSEAWVYKLRREFPVATKSTFLDIAYENCGATFTRQALEQYLQDWSDTSPGVVKAGGEGKGRTMEVVAVTRDHIARLLGGVDPSHIAFTKNTNEGINAVLQGFPFQTGDNVITFRDEHPSVIMPCLHLALQGVECRIAEADDGVSLIPEKLLSYANERTRFIVISHVQSRTGYKIDLEHLAALCRERGIYLLVDAIQSLGFCPLDAQAWRVHGVASACYKGLLGIHGLGFLYTAPELLQELTPVFVASNRAIRLDLAKPGLTFTLPSDGRKLENSTLNFIGIYVLLEALQRIERIGIDNIAHHISYLLTKLYTGLDALGYSVITPGDAKHRCHSLALADSTPEKLYAHFLEQGVFASLSGGRYLRLSVAPFNTEEDISEALRVAALYPIAP
ncbi:MAG: aminotransferase class V-fold PLP-dependent enzyme [Symbiobacteriaceae bacterium]|nr:aminotransferase class V-fold PLP-dependent enzyme [Symbiobacteriaceae bacterium]